MNKMIAQQCIAAGLGVNEIRYHALVHVIHFTTYPIVKYKFIDPVMFFAMMDMHVYVYELFRNNSDTEKLHFTDTNCPCA